MSEQLPLDRPVTCQDILYRTADRIAKVTHRYGNDGMANIICQQEYLDASQAQYAACLARDLEATKRLGNARVEVVKRILATIAEQEQLRLTAEQRLSAALGQPVQVELVPHTPTAPQEKEG